MTLDDVFGWLNTNFAMQIPRIPDLDGEPALTALWKMPVEGTLPNPPALKFKLSITGRWDTALLLPLADLYVDADDNVTFTPRSNVIPKYQLL